MTMPDERTRALIWAGSFLIDLALDSSLSPAVRRQAVVIARHFPTLEDVKGMAMQSELSKELGPALSYPHEVDKWVMSFNHGPLLRTTRLPWPPS